MREYWKLQATDEHSVTHQIFGTEEMMRAAYDEWKQAVEEGSAISTRVLEAHGFVDTADRGDSVIGIRMEQIVAMSLVRMV